MLIPSQECCNKPIPKYILKMIEREDKKRYTTPYNGCRFYAYLTIWKKELVKVTAAVRHYKKKLYFKQVAWHGIHSTLCYVKDIEYNYVGMGFRVGWYAEGLQKGERWYEQGVCSANDKYYDPYCIIVNLALIDKFPEYKYSAYQLFTTYEIFKYLRIYEQYPNAEILLKLKMPYYATKKTLLRRLQTNKDFRRWFLLHKTELEYSHYYVSTIFKAYKENMNLDDAQKEEELLKSFYADNTHTDLNNEFKKDIIKFIRYLKDQRTSTNTYYDYYVACRALGLDMTLAKNRYPHDFSYWHDARTNEYHVQQAVERLEKEKELKELFTQVAEKYTPLQFQNRHFLCIIPKSPIDLVQEGNQLHHCVGRMGYDKKFATEQTLIFFVRSVEHPDTPFVTLEYSLEKHSILQVHGEHNKTPDDNVLRYIHKTWLPHANKALQQIQLAA